MPPNVRLEHGFDQTRNVKHRLDRLGIDFAIAIGLVLLTLTPLGLRAASVVMISIPLSLAIGLAALYFTGFSLNQLSIAGFVLALGLLVDDSIVVVENIERYLRAGYNRVEAAIAATDQIALAVVGCTATLLFAFLPLLFLPGRRHLHPSLPPAVLFTVAASLLVSLTVVPFLASRLLQAEGHGAEGNKALQGLMRVIHGIYGPPLRVALAAPKRTLLAALAFVLASFGLTPLMGFSLFPNADIPQFRIAVETPTGASLADTDRAVRFIEAELRRHEEVKHVFANVGRGNPRIYYNIFPEEKKANVGEVFVELRRSTRARRRRCWKNCGRRSPATPAHASSSRAIATARRSTHRSRSRSWGPTSMCCRTSRTRPKRSWWRRRARATSTTRRVACAPISTCASIPTRLRCSASLRSRSTARCALRSRASPWASTVKRTATNTTSRCACRCRSGSSCRRSITSRSPRRAGSPCRCGS